jgi:hypothetical protein
MTSFINKPDHAHIPVIDDKIFCVNIMKSKELAKLIGPTLTVMSSSEMINLHIWVTNIPAITYLNGIILFVLGLSIIRIHNFWALKWHVIITIAGWCGIAGGLFRVFFPEARQGGENILTYTIITLFCLTGLFLSYKGYRANSA